MPKVLGKARVCCAEERLLWGAAHCTEGQHVRRYAGGAGWCATAARSARQQHGHSTRQCAGDLSSWLIPFSDEPVH